MTLKMKILSCLTGFNFAAGITVVAWIAAWLTNNRIADVDPTRLFVFGAWWLLFWWLFALSMQDNEKENGGEQS